MGKNKKNNSKISINKQKQKTKAQPFKGKLKNIGIKNKQKIVELDKDFSKLMHAVNSGAASLQNKKLNTTVQKDKKTNGDKNLKKKCENFDKTEKTSQEAVTNLDKMNI